MDDAELMGVLGAIALVLVVAGAAVRRSHAADVLAALESFEHDPSWREATFHRELKKFLLAKLPAKRLGKIIVDATIPRTTTKVDLHIAYGQVDYLVTVKKGLSAQKVKVVAGEVQEIYMYWPKNSDRKTVVVVMLFGDLQQGAGDDHLGKVIELTEKTNAQRSDMSLQFVISKPSV